MTAFSLPQIANDWALFLDVDGTLLDLGPRPDAVTVPHGLREALADLQRRLDGALALVSGRAISNLDRLFAPLRLPAAGQHGAELRPRADAAVTAAAGSVSLDILAERLGPFAASHPGVVVEAKGLSVALHCRQAPEALGAAGKLVRSLVAETHGALDLLPAHFGFDIKLRRASKGRAVAAFLAEAPFHGRVPVFAGDDATDEGAFAAVLERGGHAIRVGGRGASFARLRVGKPAELRRWLGVRVPAEGVSP